MAFSSSIQRGAPGKAIRLVRRTGVRAHQKMGTQRDCKAYTCAWGASSPHHNRGRKASASDRGGEVWQGGAPWFKVPPAGPEAHFFGRAIAMRSRADTV